MSETDEGAVEASDFEAARTIWREEMNTGPDPFADPARWIGGTDDDSDERRER